MYAYFVISLGKPSSLLDLKNKDWLPTLNLGYTPRKFKLVDLQIKRLPYPVKTVSTNIAFIKLPTIF